jgi:hypothetical protein
LACSLWLLAKRDQKISFKEISLLASGSSLMAERIQ